jgi:hypothetical protein
MLLVLSFLLRIVLSSSMAYAQPTVPQDDSRFDGPAELPRLYVKTSLRDTPAPGKIVHVHAGEDPSQALARASCGDIVELQAGATFGRLLLPQKKCDDSHWIIVRTSAPDSKLPSEGTRLTPCYAGIASLAGRPGFACDSTENVLSKIEFSSRSGSGPLTIAPGANHYRLIGLEVTRVESPATIYNLISPDNGPADHLVFDRMWIHGTSHSETVRGLMLSRMQYVGVVDSYFSDFHCVAKTGACIDSQAIAGGLGDDPMGPYKIENNFLEAAAESILFGGGGATATPSDIEIRHNHLFKPLIWMRGVQGFVGGTDGNPFIVKNLFELKNAERVLVEGNIMENTWGGFSQVGFAILLTPKNPGACQACKVRDVTIRYDRIAHCGAAMNIANGLSDNGLAAQEGGEYSIHDLIFDDMKYEECQGCSGDMFQITTSIHTPPALLLHAVSIRHVTLATNRARAGWIIAGAVGQKDMTFQDNIVDAGTIGYANAGGGAAQCYFRQALIKGVLDSCWSTYHFDHNIIMNANPKHSWPSGNWPIGGVEQVGFARWRGGVAGDYHLTAQSKFKGKAFDGKDPGADIDAVNSLTTGVQ